MNGMSRKDLLSALDVLNARLDFEFGAALKLKIQPLRQISFPPGQPRYDFAGAIWLAPDGHGRDRQAWCVTFSPSPDAAAAGLWESMSKFAGLPPASSGEELELKLSLLPDRDVRDMLRRIAYLELAYARRRTA